LRALAVTGAQRSTLVPELPTVSESGLPGYSVTAWFGLLAPAATPHEIVARISGEMQKGFKTPRMHERFSALGADPVGGSPDQFAAFLKSEMAKWATLVKAAGIKSE
jgi:tripartite-type tricarboxylate transporter receptor subunit TctC